MPENENLFFSLYVMVDGNYVDAIMAAAREETDYDGPLTLKNAIAVLVNNGKLDILAGSGHSGGWECRPTSGWDPESADKPDSVKWLSLPDPLDVEELREHLRSHHDTDVKGGNDDELDAIHAEYHQNAETHGWNSWNAHSHHDNDPTPVATCKHCGRGIVREGGAWVDPNATGDDAIWREACDAHDTITAEHEPGIFSKPAMRLAAPEEATAWLAGHRDIEGAIETDEGLLVPAYTPGDLMDRYLAGARGEAALDERMTVLWDIIADIRDSYRQAMQAVPLSSETIHEVDTTVLDYLTNNYGED
jgi:hypothetical protein